MNVQTPNLGSEEQIHHDHVDVFQASSDTNWFWRVIANEGGEKTSKS